MKRAVLIPLFVISCLQGFSQSRVDSLIDVLKKEIDQQDIYVNRKFEKINGLRARLPGAGNDLTKQFDVYTAIFHEYKAFINDSALHYAQILSEIAHKLNDKSRIGDARVKSGFVFISAGMFKETFDSLGVVEVKYLNDTSRIEYYRLLSRVYGDINTYNKNDYFRKRYSIEGGRYLDSAYMWSKPGTYIHAYLNAIITIYSGKYEEGIAAEKALFQFPLSYHQQAMDYHDMANAYRAIGNNEKMLEAYIMAALCDLRAPTKETAAMLTLAQQLYQLGDSKNAYIFIKQALREAEFYGAMQRQVEISSILPVIAADQLNSVDEQRKRWLVFSAALTLFVIIIIVFSVIIYKQLKKLKAAEAVIREANRNLNEINHKLLEADKIKEEYIGYYFSNNSGYIDKIESFKRTIDRKLQHHKVDDIRQVVNTINPDHEREELYFNFDKIFLKLFPDFVTTFNSYFEPENKIVLKEHQLLNTELRIFALIRLGIHDAEKIAKILGYSVNTIYAYRNRIKGRSILPNDKFEEKIMEIKTVSIDKTMILD